MITCGLNREGKLAALGTAKSNLVISWERDLASGDSRWWKVYYIKAKYPEETRRTLYFKWFRIMFRTNVNYEGSNGKTHEA